MKLTSENGVITPSKPKFVPSKYQQDVFAWVQMGGSSPNLVVEACAGSGKTTSAVEAFRFLPDDIEKCFVAFNKHIQMELQNRLPVGATTKTYHALGLANIQNFVGKGTRIEVDAYKLDNILRNKIGPNGKFMLPSIKRMVGLCKANMVWDIETENLNMLAIDYDIELFDDRSSDAKEMIFECVIAGYKKSAQMTEVVDFDDMLWMPIYLDMPIKTFDFLLVDEFQDTNRAHGMLAIRSTADGGRLVGVGDKFQSIYGWAGADQAAMDRLRETMHADILPLSITYRCPKAVVRYVNEKFPEIKFEGADWAKEGKIENITAEQAENMANDKDMILCRVNADLVPFAFSLIRKGIKASIRGRDIGKNLASLIRKVGGNDLSEMLHKLYEYRDREVQKLYAADRAAHVQFINDKVDTIVAISDACQSVGDVLYKCETLFSDEVAGVVLSSIHRAKGLEANRVYILRPDLLPHPAAKSDSDKRSERNLEYVAVTRTADELYFVR